ncbi:MAG: translation initiation factor IF-3 [Verrucomicrobiales bacterium]|nr:translation initiation factor IF-3 [Verrucomicrobiales bacterium]
MVDASCSQTTTINGQFNAAGSFSAPRVVVQVRSKYQSHSRSHEIISTFEGSLSRPFGFRPFPSREPSHRRNGKIRAREVRVLDEMKQPLGVMSLGEALKLAQSKGMDLIEIAATATPPVCRIIEYGKFQYEEAKRKKESAAKQPSRQMKELQLTPNIDPNDFRVKLNHAIEFLCNEQTVRIKLRFRGRQRAHKEFGYEVVNRFIRETAAYGRSDSVPKMAGDRDLHATISPLPRDQRAKQPKEVGAPTASSAPKAAAAKSEPTPAAPPILPDADNQADASEMQTNS